MYIPPLFRVDDPEWTDAFLHRHPFATLITVQDDRPFATHLPVLYQRDGRGLGRLRAHVARGNPQWRHFGREEVLTIFSGPHAYVSPTWYETQPAVPTWNYAAVHVYGVPVLISEGGQIRRLVEDTITRFEATQPNPWDGRLPAEWRDTLLKSIVAFEIPIARIEAKLKASQNRSAVDAHNVQRHLQQGDPNCQEIAALMRSSPPGDRC